MTKVVINHELLGFEQCTIEEFDRFCNADEVVVVTDETVDKNIKLYYDTLQKLMISGVKVILIVVSKSSKFRKTLMYEAMAYRNYNIYRVDSIDTVDERWIRNVENREPSVLEVQQYVGSDISAYSELNNILFGLQELTKTGDIEGIKTFVDNHIESIEKSVDIIEYLKIVFEKSNSNMLMESLKSAQGKLDESIRENNRLTEELGELRNTNQRYADEKEALEGDKKRLRSELRDIKEELKLSSDGHTISVINTINTSLIKCKTKTIIYFKEISYVRYTNSFVVAFMETLKQIKHGIKIKLVIYDTKVGINGIYKGINVYDSKTFLEAKESNMKSERLVFSEPNSSYLEDILTSVSPEYDIVIVYDRLGQVKDIVTGNNVCKIFVINSNTQLEAVRDTLGINQTNLVISGDSSDRNAICIPTIDGYKLAKESNKMKMLKATDANGVSIIKKIAQAAHIQLGA